MAQPTPEPAFDAAVAALDAAVALPAQQPPEQQQQEPLITLVSYCSRERAFIDPLVANARRFSDLVVVSLGTRLFTGEAEDVEGEAGRLVAAEEQERGLCPTLVVAYDVAEPLLRQPIVLHNRAREAGAEAAARWVGPGRGWWALLLDGDEVPDGPRVRRWWQGPGGQAARKEPHTVLKMANRWAFLHPRLVAEAAEDSVLLAHSSVLLHPHAGALQHPRERDGVYLAHAASPLGKDVRLRRDVRDDFASDTADTADPLFTHYSWVRGDPAWFARATAPGLGPAEAAADAASLALARLALKAKVANWGHRDDRDWAAEIDAAFDAVAAGGRWPERDFVHGHRLRWVRGASDCAGGQDDGHRGASGIQWAQLEMRHLHPQPQ